MPKVKLRSRFLWSSAVVAGLCTAMWNGQVCAQVPEYNFDIPSESLSAALREFARVSGQQIIFTDDLVSGKSAPALHGSYSADDALSYLLAGTNLVVERAPSGAIMVRRKNGQAASNDGAPTFDAADGVHRQAEASGDLSSSLETITVTARKRAENLQSTPLAITALNGNQLEKQQINSISDLNLVVPSLYVNPIPSTAGSVSVSLRGFNFNNPNNPLGTHRWRSISMASTKRAVSPICTVWSIWIASRSRPAHKEPCSAAM